MYLERLSKGSKPWPYRRSQDHLQVSLCKWYPCGVSIAVAPPSKIGPVFMSCVVAVSAMGCRRLCSKTEKQKMIHSNQLCNWRRPSFIMCVVLGPAGTFDTNPSNELALSHVSIAKRKPLSHLKMVNTFTETEVF